MGLVLTPSLMVITIRGILLYAKVSPLFSALWKWLCCCLEVNYIVYKHFDRLLQVESSNPTCVQNFRPVPLTVMGSN